MTDHETTGADTVKRNGALTVTEGFGGDERHPIVETNASTMAAQARAAIESRYVMALQRPRNLDATRVALLKECSRPSFAALARYAKPIGDTTAEGFSIRFVEAAMRCLRNILAESSTIYDDAAKRIVRVTLTDLEANVTFPRDITIEKRVERSRPRDGQKIFGVRTNSRGRKTYTVEATEDDLLMKEASLTSKAIRQAGLRLVPGDILEECAQRIEDTLRDATAKDPDMEKKRIIDAFAALRVGPEQLEQFLGHGLELLNPIGIAELRKLYCAIRDGEASWIEILELRTAEHRAELERLCPDPPTDAPDSQSARLRARLSPPSPPPERNPPVPRSTEPGDLIVPSGTIDQGAPEDAAHAEELAFASARAEFDRLFGDLKELVGDREAAVQWNAVKSLRGCKTAAHVNERIAQAETLVARVREQRGG